MSRPCFVCRANDAAARSGGGRPTSASDAPSTTARRNAPKSMAMAMDNWDVVFVMIVSVQIAYIATLIHLMTHHRRRHFNGDVERP